MAKIIAEITDPTPEYDPSNIRQAAGAVRAIRDQLNTSYQTELKNEQDALTFFLS
jgi:hypothetical protein